MFNNNLKSINEENKMIEEAAQRIALVFAMLGLTWFGFEHDSAIAFIGAFICFCYILD